MHDIVLFIFLVTSVKFTMVLGTSLEDFFSGSVPFLPVLLSGLSMAGN